MDLDALDIAYRLGATEVRLRSQERLDALRTANHYAIAMARKFVAKVESGRARSVETYHDCKRYLAFCRAAGLLDEEE